MTHEEQIIERLKAEQMLSVGELDCLLTTKDTETVEKLKAEARMAAQSVYGKQIYIRGLIEFTNYCKNDCYYCGIRRGNACAERYRLTEEQILFCCATGYSLDSAPLSCRAEKTPILQMRRSAVWCLRSSGHTRTVQ